MKYRKALFRSADPYDADGSEELFAGAMRENCAYQYEHCGDYRRILDGMEFAPDDLQSTDDLAKLPPLPTLLFKNHQMYSLTGIKAPVLATSSGTKGQFSKIRFELSGLLCGLRMVLKIGRRRKLFSPIPTHYVVFGYKPHKGNQTAVTKTALGATLFAPAIRRKYALIWKDGGYVPDLDGIIEAVLKYSKSRFPTRLMGFPSYTYFVLKRMDEKGIRVHLPKGSKIMLGGGWKQFYLEQVDKQILYDLAKRVLDMEEDQIVEFFGAVEHPILYCDCPCHHFHVPVYSRVLVRDVHTMEPLPTGRVGLVNLMTPMVKATPILSVMTDDLGVLHPGGDCPCGNLSPYLEAAARRHPSKTVGGAAEITLLCYENRLEQFLAGQSESHEKVYAGYDCRLIACEDSELVLSGMFGSCPVKRLPQSRMFAALRSKKGYLQSVALLCDPEKREMLTDRLARIGLCRIVRAGDLSTAFCGETHDGEYPLRRYRRYVNFE
ncbi:MAG: acyl-CoA reductase [Eubacteriales bacterium]